MRILVTFVTLIFLAASPILAFDINEMSEGERQIFRQEVRAYLLENPEVLMEAIAVLEQRQEENQATNDQDLVASYADPLFDDGYSYVGGNPDGDVVIVEFLDYRCGYCKRAHPEVAELIRSDGNIIYIVKEFPILGEQSDLASRFAISVLHNTDLATYAKAHDALMGFRGEISIPSLERLSGNLGLDTAAIIQGMDSPEVRSVIGKNRALGQSMAITGTPSFVFGDQMVRGYVPLDGMREIVAQLRADASN